MEAHNSCSSAIVAQFLTGKDNYENWRACIKNYLSVRDLWDVVEQTSEPPQREYEAAFMAWRKRDLSALHAIQISCDPIMLSFIRNKNTDKDAWKTLFELCHVPEDAPEIPEDRHVGREITVGFLEAIRTRELEMAKNLLRNHPHLAYTGIRAMADLTIFHFAIFEGQLEMIDEFLSIMSAEHMGMVDRGGNTVLHYVALCSENTEIAKRLIIKNKELLTTKNGAEDIPLDRRGDIPLNFACLVGHKEKTHHLYNATTPGFLLKEENKRQAALVVRHCISNKLFDVALDLLRHRPQLAFAEVDGMNAVSVLSSQPSAFRSGCQLSFCQRWIYSRLKVKQPTSGNDVRINTYEVQDQRQMNNFTTQVAGQLLGLRSNLLKFFGIKKIYDLKKAHAYANEILLLMSKEIAGLDFAQVRKKLVHQAIINAAQRGMKEFIVEIIKRNLDLLMTKDVDDRDMFMIAVAHRQEKVFSLIYGLDTKKHLFLPFVDKLGNSMLHVAGKLSSESQVKLEQSSRPGLQMQRELQWFEGIESIVPPIYKKYSNRKGETPFEVFNRSHAELVKEEEKSMKNIAQSSSVVGALIITITFAALFTVPGGLNQDTGVPILSRKTPFKVFVISDVISLFASTTSVLTFLDILTSRYSTNDFLKSLPKKLIIGLSSLLISIATMMIAFSSTAFITLKGQLEIVIPIVLLVGVPFSQILWLQFPLLFEIFISTYGPGIFDKKIKWL